MQKIFSLTFVIATIFWCNSFAQVESSSPPKKQSNYKDTSPAIIDNSQKIPSVKEGLRENFSQSDYENFLLKEKLGEIPFQGGVVDQMASADALVNNNTGSSGTSYFTQSETSIIAFGNSVLIGFNDSGSNGTDGNKFTGFSYSPDGGTNFTDGGTLPTNTGGDAGDPVIARNEATGRIYFSTLGYGVSTIQVFRSDNNGLTWMAPINGTPGGSSEDKQWIAVDNFAGTGNGNVYLISRRFSGSTGIYLFRSTDNGNSFNPGGGVSIYSGGQGAFISVGPDHSVYAFYYDGSTSIQVRKSTDFGVSFGGAVTVFGGLTGGSNGDLDLVGIRQGTSTASYFRSNSFPHAAVNPISGHIYVTFNNDPSGTDKADVYMTKSTNSGTTWSTPERVNDDATTTDQWQPTIAVTTDGANIGIFYYSRQEDAANNLFKYYGRTGTISGSTVTFTPSFAISDVASLPEFGRDGVVNSTYMGDYNHASATANEFHVVWSDNRNDLAGGSPRKDPNVYYEKILLGPPCPINQAYSPSPVNGSSNVSINVPNISWTNGAGATQCEVWFGVAGSMTKVYDGTLIQSWNISGPLSYNTPYNWQIIGKNGTCSVSGPLWTFMTEQDPNLVIETVIVYPQNFNYWTGTCNSSSKTQVSLVDADGSAFAGWMKFDISSIPNNATINSITLNGYLYSNNFPYWSVTPMGSVNPETGSASLIYDQVSNNYDDGVAYSYNQESGTLTNGWIQRSLGTTATIDMQNKLGQGWFAIGIYDWDSGTTYYVNFQGWAEANRPYLEVVYEYTLVADPTGITASAVNDTQIDVAFTPNASNNNVVIVWNNTGTFTTPTGTPPAIGQSFAGGTLLYNGIVSPVNHTGLTGLTTYYYKLFSYDGFDYSSGVSTSAATFSALDFGVNLTVIDNCDNNAHPLIFGTAPGATECFDAGFDLSAPPPPPVGAIDGRFLSCNDAFFTDIRGSNPGGERIWDVHFQPDAGCSPISLSWDPSKLPVNGYFHLLDPYFGTLVNVNMRTSNSYTDVTGLGYLQIKFNYQICSNFNVSNGWNMLSLPLGVTDNNYLTLFPTAVAGTLYGYEGAYVTTTTIENGAGYWLKFSSAEFVEVCGSDETETIIELAAGWNMIGGPNCNVQLSSVIDPGGIIIPGTLYGYSGSYFTATSIDGTKGYWIKTNAAGTITISCSAPPPNNINNNIIAAETLTEFGAIKISDASEVSQTLYFDGDLNEDINIESFSMPPVPPAGSFDARLAGDYRLTESDEVTIQVQSTQFPIKLTISNINSGESYLLTEMAKGAEVSSQKIIDGTEILISNEEVTILKITKQQSLPITYNLEQNYPNPFNPSTTIKFSLPETANVTLSIYNALGQKVGEIVNTNLEAGWYSYQWDATNIATGIYIYELSTDKFISVKKMILLK